ncbi:MAG: hypothetical protein AAF943_12090 [Pseudomonadota bacterium]
MTTLKTLKSIVLRTQDTLLQDAIGAAALLMIFITALYLPVIV